MVYVVKFRLKASLPLGIQTPLLFRACVPYGTCAISASRPMLYANINIPLVCLCGTIVMFLFYSGSFFLSHMNCNFVIL